MAIVVGDDFGKIIFKDHKGTTIDVKFNGGFAAVPAEIKRAGASWDYPGYKPHVTITYKGPSPSLSDIKSYDGDLIFGPERFQEVEEDWEQKITEKSDPMARALAAIAALRRK